MKTRLGFVSNSSSCSFTISKKGLTDEQIGQIKNHIEVAKKLAKQGKVQYTDASKGWEKRKKVGGKKGLDLGYLGEEDTWDVKDQGDKLLVGTIITNFNLEAFVKAIGVPKKNISDMTDSWWPEEEKET